MQCFKKFKKRNPKISTLATKHSKEKTIINNVLSKYTKYTIKQNDNRKLGEILFTFILDPSYTPTMLSLSTSYCKKQQEDNSTDDLINLNLIRSILNTKLIDINEIKNFLNQTLLHIVTEKNLINLCKNLVNLGANCMLEDNYRQTPLLIAAKSNYFQILKIFCNSIKLQTQLYMYENYKEYHLIRSQQIFKAAYYACCSNNYEIVDYLFENFALFSEQLQFDDNIEIVTMPFSEDSDSDSKLDADLIKNNNNNNKNMKIKLKYEINCHTSELNALHVACYNAYFEIVKYLVENSIDKKTYVNMPINKFRDSTPLEEAFKGLLALNYKYEFEINSNRIKYFTKLSPSIDFEIKKNEKIKLEQEYKQIINYLIENGAKFSINFLVNNEFANTQQVFYGELKHLNFIHYLNSVLFLFQYRIDELFELYFNDTGKLKVQKKNIDYYVNRMLDELLYKFYLIILKILKDYKHLCLSLYSNLISILMNERNNGIIKINTTNLLYIKERNFNLYDEISTKLSNPLSLQQLCYSKIKSSIKNFGINKVNELNLPNILKQNILPDYKHIDLESF